MKDLTVGKESRLILNFAIPMLLGNVFQQFYQIVDSIIVGRVLGKEALAAVGSSFPIIFTLIALIIGISGGINIIIAQYYGAKDLEKVNRAIDTMYIFIFLVSIVLTAIGILFSESIFKLIQLPEDVLPEALTYLNTYLLGLVFFFGFNGTSAVLRGLGDSKTPLYFLIISTTLNIGLDLLFIMKFNMGIRGAALATVIAQGIAFITAVIYLNRYHSFINIVLKKLVFAFDIFRKSMKIGLPTGFQHTFVSLGMLALFAIVNGFGTNVIAAYSAAIRIDALATIPAMNFSFALATFVGQNLGANKAERVKKGLNATIIMSSIISLIVTLVVILFGKSLMGMFTRDQEVIKIGWQYLVIVSSFYLVFTGMFTLNGVLRGAGDTLIPMFITLFSLWVVRIPAAWLLSSRMGETGIWWAAPAAWIVGIVASYFYYMTGNWKKKVVVKYPV
ncbi:MAG: MATE family efflux transporter [Bacteroidota bacterium]